MGPEPGPVLELKDKQDQDPYLRVPFLQNDSEMPQFRSHGEIQETKLVTQEVGAGVGGARVVAGGGREQGS